MEDHKILSTGELVSAINDAHFPFTHVTEGLYRAIDAIRDPAWFSPRPEVSLNYAREQVNRAITDREEANKRFDAAVSAINAALDALNRPEPKE